MSVFTKIWWFAPWVVRRYVDIKDLFSTADGQILFSPPMMTITSSFAALTSLSSQGWIVHRYFLAKSALAMVTSLPVSISALSRCFLYFTVMLVGISRFWIGWTRWLVLCVGCFGSAVFVGTGGIVVGGYGQSVIGTDETCRSSASLRALGYQTSIRYTVDGSVLPARFSDLQICVANTVNRLQVLKKGTRLGLIEPAEIVGPPCLSRRRQQRRRQSTVSRPNRRR